MPYDVVKRGKKWCVVSPSKTHGCHSSKAKARAQQRALYRNAPPSEEAAVSTSAENTTLPDVEEASVSITLDPDVVKATVREVMAEMAETEHESAGEEEQRGPEWYGPLGLEGHPTSDRRVLMAGEIDDRDLPLPINVQILTGEGHENSRNAGRIESIEHIPWTEFPEELKAEFGLDDKEIRDEAVVIYAEGTFDLSEWADEAMRQMENGAGISLDLPTDRAALLDPETLEEVDTEGMELEDLLFGDYLTGYSGKVGGATIVGVPAFEEASIKIVEDRVLVASAGFGIKLVQPKPLTAAAGPVKPPKEWFLDPCLTELTPLTITKDGQVFGHLADWDGCHVGFQGICVPPFRSASEYAYFNTGIIETAEGDEVPCGKLMFSMDGAGHADVDDMDMTYQDVQAYYDNATHVGAFVRAGSDRFGTWLAGSLRHGLTDIEVQHLKSHPPSGDWRPVKGVGELIAAFAVPVGGFPIPRRALVASANNAITAIITAPLVVDGELGWRKNKRKKYMLSQRLQSALGHKASTRERMRREHLAKLKSDDAA